jgi:hypothetical protein
MLKTTVSFIFIVFTFFSEAQNGLYIYSKEGRPILDRKTMLYDCVRSLHKEITDLNARSICNCEFDKLNHAFTYKQWKKYSQDRIINIENLLKEDSLIQKQITECYTASGKSILVEAESFENSFISNCVKNIEGKTEKKLNPGHLNQFCECQLELVKSKQLTDKEFEAVKDPNSLLFYETVAKCGDPYESEGLQGGWNENAKNDIIGPNSYTINVLSLGEMTYIKAKIGEMLRIWLFDTGASELLINAEMEKELRDQKILTDSNYLGINDFEMANGTKESCRRYLVKNIQIGKFLVNNVPVAVTEKRKKIIIGRDLLNKFSSWTLDSRSNKLVLSK